MAKVQNFNLKDQVGKLGGAVYYVVAGETRSRKLAASVANPRTSAQMLQRVKWANLVNFYRANASWMKYAYETKKATQSEYNKFMSLNVSSSRIYLPKSVAAGGGCIVDSYIMTQGSLPSVEVTAASAAWYTNIYLQDASGLGTNSTVAEVSQQILAANPALREGDQLSFIRFTQQTNASTGVPYVVVRKYEVILSTTDYRRFFDFWPEDYIAFATPSDYTCIGVSDSGLAGGFIFIVSRTTGGKTRVSTQSIIVANNSALIDAYSSQNALQTAIDSYGESSEPFLTSTVAEIDENAPVRPSVLSAAVEDISGVPGQQFIVAAASAGDDVKLHFNQSVEGDVDSGELIAWQGGEQVTINLTGTAGGTTTKVASLPSGASLENAYIQEITFNIHGGDSYRAVFFVPNEATISGLE